MLVLLALVALMPSGARPASATAPVSMNRAETQASTTEARAAETGCAALGNYPVGPRAALQAHVSSRLGIEPPLSPWRLAGNVILSAYTGCGQPTAGTFSIQGELMGSPVAESGNITVTLPCAQACLGPALATISGHGAFHQDATHPSDPLYVSVDAVLVTGVGKSRPAHAILSKVMGYLQVRPGHSARLTVLPPPTLSFLPAATAHAGVLSPPLVIYGWRGM